jgi:hypothetical protein
MALNEDPTTWLGTPIKAINFATYGIEELEYNTLLQQAANRAKTYILDTLKIKQETLDNVDGPNVDSFQLAYQKLSFSEFLKNQIGLFANTLPFGEYETPEGERVVQSELDLEKWLRMSHRLRQEALQTLNDFIPVEFQTTDSLVEPYNWN